MKKEVLEGEVIQHPDGFKYKERYQFYSEATKNISGFAWSVSILSLFFSFIPIAGFIFAWFALIVALIKNTPKIIPIISIFISSAITMFVLFIAWIVSLIF